MAQEIESVYQIIINIIFTINTHGILTTIKMCIFFKNENLGDYDMKLASLNQKWLSIKSEQEQFCKHLVFILMTKNKDRSIDSLNEFEFFAS